MSTEVHKDDSAPVPITTLTAETIKPGMIVVLEDGRVGRATANLTIQEIETGLIADNRFNTTRITPQNRQQYRERRYELARQAAANGVLRAAPPSARAKTEYDAYAYMVGKQFLLACDTETGRSSTEAAKFISRVMDLLPDGGKNDQSITQNTQINLVDGQLDALIERLQALRDRRKGDTGAADDVIDAEAQ